MSLSTLEYGTLKLTDHKVTIRQDFVYDSDERTQLGTTYTVTVSGIISRTSTDTFRVYLLQLREQLSKNAQRLRVFDAEFGVTILDLDPAATAGETAVHDYGPRVTQFQISELAGLRSAHFFWQATAFRKDCGSSLNGNVSGILSIQRTYSYSLDVAGYATRAVSGTLKVTKQAGCADRYRAQVEPGCPTRFRRIQRQFSTSPDGRTLTFNIVDQEVYATLPTQIADGEATWAIRIADLGARVFYVLNGRFRGGPTTPKAALFGHLLALIQSRFPMTDPSLIFEEASVDDAVYDNEITFSIVASGVIASAGSGTQIFNSVFAGMMKPPPASNGISFLPGPYGDLPGTPHIAPLFPLGDACSFEFPAIPSSPVSIQSVQADGVYVNSGGGWAENVSQDNVSAQHLTTPFVEFVERIGYHFDYKVSRMDRKSSSAVPSPDPEFTRSSLPSVIATQTGYMKVMAKSATDLPACPEPIWPSGVLRESFISPDVGDPVADGIWKRFTVHWRYVIEWKSYVSSQAPGDAFVAFPVEPRIGKGKISQGSYAGRMPWLTGGLQ